jgi:hypothetical protein
MTRGKSIMELIAAVALTAFLVGAIVVWLAFAVRVYRDYEETRNRAGDSGHPPGALSLVSDQWGLRARKLPHLRKNFGA